MGGCMSADQGSKKEKIKIEYFGMGYARADPIRFLLHHANVDYEYVGYDFETWGKMKAEGKGGEFGGLPRATVNGKEMGQSMAILRSLGQKYGYYNASDWKSSYFADVILDSWVDLLDKSNGALMGGKTPAEHEEIITKFHIPHLNMME